MSHEELCVVYFIQVKTERMDGKLIRSCGSAVFVVLFCIVLCSGGSISITIPIEIKLITGHNMCKILTE